MERQEVITFLSDLVSIEYSYPEMFNIYRDMMIYMDYIKDNVSNITLYNKLNLELKNVFNEARFGDNDDNSIRVYNDCILIIKHVIRNLSKLRI